MPTWDKILEESRQFHPLYLLERYVKNLYDFTNNTTICYLSAFTIIKPPVPSVLHSVIDQDIQGFMTCSKDVQKRKLDLILHTPGGDYEATKRIINYLHETYSYIRVFVPHMAMSGGTLIACAADEIYMGPYSSLGPTDPQILINNRYIPIGAVIKEFEKAFEEVTKEPKKAILWIKRLEQIPFGLYDSIITMRDNSNRYLKELLLKRNCKNKTEEEVDKIVKLLNTHSKHSSHGKGISLTLARDELQLNIKNLHSFKELEDRVLSVYHAATILFQQTQIQKIIINNNGKKFIVQTPSFIKG